MVSGFLDSADKAGASTRMKIEPMDMYSLNLIGDCRAVASDDILQIIFRGWMPVMILTPATRPDLVAWLCRFLTTLQLHWWILFVLCLIGHCLAVASDDILQIIFRGWMPVMILIPATRPDLVAWLCRFLTTLQLHWWILFVLCLIGHCLAVASDDILQIIFRGWMPVMILIPATRPDLVAWLCRFLTTLQLHWWICSCCVWLDTVFLWPVMISYKSSFGADPYTSYY